MDNTLADPTPKQIISYIKKLDKNSAKFDPLKKVFASIVNRKNVQLTMITVLHILKFNLNIDILTISNEKEFLILPMAKSLIYYIKYWPGWSKSKKYYSDMLPYKTWYSEFQNFLIEKVQYLLNNYALYMTDEPLIEDKTKKLNDGDKYELVINTKFDNFTCSMNKNDLIFRVIEQPASTVIDFQDLLNLPYFSSEINLPNVFISRNNVHKLERYITTNTNTSYSNDNSSGKLEVVLLPNNKSKSKPVKCTFHELKICFNNILKKLEGFKLYAGYYELVFSEFLKDLQDCALTNETISTNAFVSYNIGNSNFIQVKNEIATDDDTEKIWIVETIKPKVEFALNYINVDDINCDSYAVKEMENITQVYSLKTSCTLCNVSFIGKFSVLKIVKHFKDLHPFNGFLTCEKCKKKDTYMSLAKQRWCHNCNSC